VLGRGEAHRKPWWGNLMERGYLKELSVDMRRILERLLNKAFGKPWT
jgi:hypothetical protein